MSTLAEKNLLIDAGVKLLIAACDTDDVYWSALETGQDSEEAEDSGYLCGYRDALGAVQQILTHDDPDTLNNYLDIVREEMHRHQRRAEELDPETARFWQEGD